MAANNKNDLKDEELQSGFGAGESGDETFFLEMKEEYPGVLPFAPFKPGKNVAASPQSPETSQADSNPDGEASVWDMFMDSPQSVPGVDASSASAKDFVQTEDSATTGDSAEMADGQTSHEPPSVDMDNDFLSMLKSELETSRKNQELKQSLQGEPAKHELSQEENDALLKEFVAPEDMGEASFIDLALIEAQHPSSYIYNEQEYAEQADNVAEPVPAIAAADPETAKPKKEKKKKEKPVKDENQDKKLGYWSIVILSSIAALLMVTIGFGVYMYLFNEDLFRKSLGIEALNSKKNVQGKYKPADKKAGRQQPKPADTLKSVPVASQNSATAPVAANQSNQVNVAPAKSQEEPKKTIPAATETRPQVNKPALAVNAPKPQPNAQNKDLAYNKPVNVPGKNDKPFASKIEKPKPESKTGTNNNAAKPNTANKKNADMASTAKTKSETNSQKTASVEKVKEVYTVQVYSTPSREDAEEWLRRLQAKNIRDAFISPQRVRDDVWYRVRFGAYESREEARAAALRLGFSQSWIDRVR